MLPPLTKSQERLFRFYLERLAFDDNPPPTLREAADCLGYSSTRSVVELRDKLVALGYITWNPNSRTIGILDAAMNLYYGLPFVGGVSAGGLRDFCDQRQGERIRIDALFQGPEVYVAQVEGDSMIGAKILDGDYLVIRRDSRAHSGDIVIARVDDQTTLKYWEPLPNGKVCLRPANDAYNPVVVDACKVSIEGIVISVVRQLK